MIRYATIGTNFIVDHFQEAAMKLEELEYAAVCSRSVENAQRLADKYKAERICTDIHELALADDIDAVYIASPNSLHFEQAGLLLSHGKHVLCEKTITSNEEELKTLLQISKEHGTVLMEAMCSVHTPGYGALVKGLSLAGRIRRVSFNFCKYSSRYDKFKSGIIENAFNPVYSNGALMDIGVYCVHPLVKLFGLPKKLEAHGLLLDNGIDGAGTILAVYDDMQAELSYSKITDSRIPSEIQGEDGSITVQGMSNPHDIIFYGRNGQKQVLYQSSDEPYMTGELMEWIRLIKEGVGENPHNQYSLMSLRLMDQARKQMGIIFPADLKR